MKSRPSLFRRATLSIGVGLLVFQVLSIAAIAAYVLMPLEEQSANDFAALLALSARTWVELPPETRPAFAAELAANHGLELGETVEPASDETQHHHMYMRYLRAALVRHADPGVVARLTEAEDRSFRVDFPMAGHPLRFSFSYDRLNSSPFRALVVILCTAALTSLAVAWLLARRISGPVRRLALAARQIGSGEHPAELPEDVEQELADLAHVFNQTSAKLATQRENRDTLLAGISHDLRSPLTRLRMALGMLAEESNSPLIARMEADIEAMDTLIGAQLQLARVRQREPAASTDVDALLRDLVGAVTATAACPVRLRTTGRPCAADVAPVALRRILANLIDNACLHGAQRPFEVVRRRSVGTIVIGVRDRGPGIPSDMREAVFRPFVRVEPSRSRATGGSGLGLAIARQIAETHGWVLAMKPRVGGGSSFWLAMPDAACPGAARAPAAGGKPGA